MANAETGNQNNQEKKSLIEQLFKAFLKMLMDKLRLQLTDDVQDSDGVLNIKLQAARQLINDADGRNDARAQASLKRAGMILLGLQKEVKQLQQARDGATDQVTLVNRVSAVESEMIDNADDEILSPGRKRELKDRTKRKKEQRIEEYNDGVRQQGAKKTEWGHKSVNELRQENEQAYVGQGERSAQLVDKDKKLEQLINQEMERIRERTDVDTGLFLRADDVRLAIVRNLDKAIEQFSDSDPRNAARLVERKREQLLAMAEKGDLPPGELEREFGLLRDQERRFASSMAVVRTGDNEAVISVGDRNRIEAELSDLYKKGEISLSEYRMRLRNLDPGNQRLADVARARIEGLTAGDQLMDPQVMQSLAESPDLNVNALARMRTPEAMQYQIETRINEKYGRRVESSEYNEALYHRIVDDLMMEILITESTKRSDYNVLQLTTQLDYLIKTQWAEKAFGIDNKVRVSKRDRISSTLAVYEIAKAGSSINFEQWAGLWKAVGGDAYADALYFQTSLKADYAVEGEEVKEPKEILLSLSEAIRIVHHHEIAMKVTSQNFNEREEGVKIIALYTIASQLEGWKEAKTSAGTTDFSKFQFKRNDEGNYEVWMEGVGKKFVLKGMMDPLTGNGYEDANALMTKARALAVFAVDLEKWGTLSMAKYNQFGDRDMNYGIYKHLGFWYSAGFDIPAWQEIFRAAHPGLQDLETENYFKRGKVAMDQLAKHNNLSQKERKLMEEAFKLLMKNADGFLMSPEQMLLNWKQLMVDRKVTTHGGKVVSRYELLPFDLKEPVSKFIEEKLISDNFDFSPWIYRHLGFDVEKDGQPTQAQFEGKLRDQLRIAPDEQLPPWINTRGMNGMRTYVAIEQRKYLYHIDEQKGSGNIDLGKQADYIYQQAEAFADRVALAAKYGDNPEKFVEYVMSKKGFTYMNREQLTRLIDRLMSARRDVYVRQLKVEGFKPGMKMVENEDKKPILSEDGSAIYQTRTLTNDYLGRERGYGQEPPWMRRYLLDEFWKLKAIENKESFEFLYGKYVENIWGLPISKLSFNPLGWAKGIPFIKGYVPHDLRWGPAPMLNWVRRQWGLLDKPKWVTDVLGEWWNIVANQTKKAVDEI